MKSFGASLVVLIEALALVHKCRAFAPQHRQSHPVVGHLSHPVSNIAASNHATKSLSHPTSLFAMDGDSMGEIAKTGIIALVFGGGLIPPLIIANKSMFQTLFGNPAAKEDRPDEDASTSLDPTLGDKKNRQYVPSSGASGPQLGVAPLLFSPDPIPLVDIVAVLGRITSAQSIVDWNNLPSTRLPNVNPNDPPKWLPRKAFKALIRKAKFQGWPVDVNTGEPIGGAALQQAEEKRLASANCLISDAALDAVFDSWAAGAGIATPDKVEAALRQYLPAPKTVNLKAFSSAAVAGRATTLLAAVTFIAIQILVFGSLFIAPLLRTVFDIDIGFGTLGS